MRDYKILLVDRDPQSLHEMGRFVDSTSEALQSGPDENILNLLKMMSHDIRGPVVSMVATLKLLNRGYYGKMDEEVANKIKELLSHATRLTGVAEEYLGRAFEAYEALLNIAKDHVSACGLEIQYAQSGLDEDKQNWQMTNQKKGGGENAPRFRSDH